MCPSSSLRWTIHTLMSPPPSSGSADDRGLAKRSLQQIYPYPVQQKIRMCQIWKSKIKAYKKVAESKNNPPESLDSSGFLLVGRGLESPTSGLWAAVDLSIHYASTFFGGFVAWNGPKPEVVFSLLRPGFSGSRSKNGSALVYMLLKRNSLNRV